MADEKIIITIIGEDKASQVLIKTGKEAEGLDKSTSKASKGIDAMSVALGNLAADALAGAVDAVKEFVTGSIDLASSAQETTSLLQNSLGPAAQGFIEDIDALANATNRSSVELQAGASTIIAMVRSMGFGQEAAADFGASMAQIAVDLGSFFNQSTEQVFQDLQAALAGSSETMLKYGIDVKETQLKNAALEMGLISQGETLDRVTRATVLQAEVLRQAADAMGDAERTSDSYENTQRGLEAALLDLQIVVGEALIPVLTEMAQEAIPAVKQAAEDAKPALEDMGKALVDVFRNSTTAMQNANLRSELDRLGISFMTLGTITKSASLSFDDVFRGLTDVSFATEKTADENRLLELALEGVRQGLDINSQGLIDYVIAQNAAFEKAEAMNAANEDLIDSTFSLKDAITSNKDAIDSDTAAKDDNARATAELSRAINRAKQENHTYEVSAEQVEAAERARAEGHKEAAEATEEAAQAMLDLKARLGDYFTEALPAVDATGSLEEQLYEAADAAGASSVVLATLAAATGNYEPEAIEAALAAAAFNEAVAQVGAAVASGQIGVPEAIAVLQDLRAELSNPPPPLIIETNVEEATAGLTEAEKVLADKLGVFTEESQGLSADASTAFGEIATAATDNMPTVEQAVTEAITNASGVVSAELPAMSTMTETELLAMATSADTNMTATVTAVETGMGDIVTAVGDGWSEAVTTAAGYEGQFVTVATSMVDGMVQAVYAGEGALVTAVETIVLAALAAAEEAAGTASPSWKTEKIFSDVVAGGVKAMDEKVGQWAEATGNAAQAAVDGMWGILGPGMSLGEQLFNGMAQAGVQNRFSFGQFMQMARAVQGGKRGNNSVVSPLDEMPWTNGAGGSSGGGSGSSSGAGSSRFAGDPPDRMGGFTSQRGGNTYILNVESRRSSESVIQDFHMMEAMAASG